MTLGIADDIGKIRDFETLLKYLRKDLDWPIDLDEIDELAFDYQPEELGLDEECRVKIREIKHLRPFSTNQPWGIFWIEFENRHLPVVVMRRILRALVPKKRASARAADRAVWSLKDLMFISSLGEQGHRRITFSHFREEKDAEPTLETFSWDERETHFYYLNRLHMDRLRWPTKPSDVNGWRQQWAGAFTAGHREPIRTAKDLSESLAALAARTRDLVLEVLKYERSDGPLHRLFESFQKVLIHDLKEHGFADMVAQTVAYGLFSARCTGQEVQGLAHLEAMVPNTNRFLKELFAELANISGHKKGQINFDDLGLSEMVDLLKNTNIEAVLEDFGRQTGGGKEDPVVHFYETFLSVYDNHQKVQRGVFYTPKPIVSFIVRSVHEILQSEFGLPDGLADTTTWRELADRTPGLEIPAGVRPDAPFVQILDPATGTGTFLEEVIEIVHKTMTSKWREQGASGARQNEAWNEYVPQHLLPRVHGFELMMAPYSVAHMKLGLKLRQTGYDFKSNQQLRIYLTNTLEPPEKGNRKLGFLPDFLSHESMQADLVKEKKPIVVVIGNPPYSGHSANNGAWVYDLLRQQLSDGANSYFLVDGASLAERNPKWLNDDYVKFLRYAQYRIATTRVGVLGFITNHGFLDNPTFRGMRQSIAHTFQSCRFLDLHGNAKRKEKTPSGDADENVFDIQQGVAISLFSNALPGIKRLRGHADLWGSRETKYSELSTGTLNSTKWATIKPSSADYLFVPNNSDLRAEYMSYWKITDVMAVNVLGFQTHRDDFAIAFTEREMNKRILALRSNEANDEEIRDEFGLRDNRDWQLSEARQKLRADRKWKARLIPCLYRPFDVRYCYFSTVAMDYPRRELIEHVEGKENICLLVPRQISVKGWKHVLVSDLVAESCVVSTKTKEQNYNFPVYLYGNSLGADKRVPNFSPAFLGHCESATGLKFVPEGRGDLARTVGPVDLICYFYAVFHSFAYRERYAEFLMRDFPRIPVTGDPALFRDLVKVGRVLMDIHLARAVKACDEERGHANGVSAERTISVLAGYPKWEAGHVLIAPGVKIAKASEETWLFEVGSYQVCHKWLRDRRGLPLSADDITTYRHLVASVDRTIRAMLEIDEIVAGHGGWPIRGALKSA